MSSMNDFDQHKTEKQRKKIITPETNELRVSELRVSEPRGKTEFQHKKKITSSGSSIVSIRRTSTTSTQQFGNRSVTKKFQGKIIASQDGTNEWVQGFESRMNIKSEDGNDSSDLEIVTMKGGTGMTPIYTHMRAHGDKPSIDGGRLYQFKIEGDAKPGNTLIVVALGSFEEKCMFQYQWVRYFEDDTSMPIEGAVIEEYAVTADDVGCFIAVDYAVVFRNGKQGKRQLIFANPQEIVTCDPEMQQEIRHYMSNGVASFYAAVELDTWVRATIFLTGSLYQIDNEEYQYDSDLSIEIPPGFNTNMELTSPNHDTYIFNFPDRRTRDVCVLTMRQFQSDYLDQFPGPSVN